MSDLISRQAAIDAFWKLEVELRPSVIDAVWDMLKSLPSAQPEQIIRCENCRWRQGSECVRFSDVRPFPDDFCSRAELRGDSE